MKDDCIIITRFAEDQPGFLDFSYRIRSLAKLYNLCVVSAKPLTQAELMVDGAEYLVLPHPTGRFGPAHYLLKCARLVHARHPRCVVLLHSLVAPLVWLVGSTPILVYWNEHPSRFTSYTPGHPLLKRIARKLAFNILFIGAARKASMVMPIGESQHEDLIQHGCDPSRVRLIHMGVDARFAQATAKGGPSDINAPVELVYMGTVHKDRGRDVMLEALARANALGPIARLSIVGASPEQAAYCTDYARRLGLEEAVSVSGRIPGSEIPAFLRHADAGLCLWEDKPWWRFNPPTKLFEYLVAGVPVLASDIRTHTHYVSDWRNGVIFNYSSDSLAAAIRRLWEHRAELPALKRRARDSGRQYLWDRIEPVFLQTVADAVHPPLSACGGWKSIAWASARRKLRESARRRQGDWR